MFLFFPLLCSTSESSDVAYINILDVQGFSYLAGEMTIILRNQSEPLVFSGIPANVIEDFVYVIEQNNGLTREINDPSSQNQID